jgi:hypothetical protein
MHPLATSWQKNGYNIFETLHVLNYLYFFSYTWLKVFLDKKNSWEIVSLSIFMLGIASSISMSIVILFSSSFLYFFFLFLVTPEFNSGPHAW